MQVEVLQCENINWYVNIGETKKNTQGKMINRSTKKIYKQNIAPCVDEMLIIPGNGDTRGSNTQIPVDT